MKKIILMGIVCLGVAFFANNIFAEDTEDSVSPYTQSRAIVADGYSLKIVGPIGGQSYKCRSGGKCRVDLQTNKTSFSGGALN